MIAEIREGGGGGQVRVGEGPHGHPWQRGCAKQAAEGVPPNDHEKWMSGGGIRQWAKQRKIEGDGGDEAAVIGRAMKWKRKAVTNYCRLRGGKGIGRWWEKKVGRVEEATCSKWGVEEGTSD